MAFKMKGSPMHRNFPETIAKDKSFENQLENLDNQGKKFEEEKHITLEKKKINGAFKSGFRDRMRVKKAKRLIRKNVGKTTIDGPDTYNISENKFNRAERKLSKADRLLKKAGYSFGEREQATGAGGYDTAMEFAKKKKKNKK